MMKLYLKVILKPINRVNNMHYLADYLLFFAKIATFVVASLILFAGILALSSRKKEKAELTFENLSEKYEEMVLNLKKEVLPKAELKKTYAELKKKKKNEKNETKKRIYLVEFNGDLHANEVQNLREELTAIISIANANDEVFLKLESPGGAVPGYGLAAAQLERLRQKQIFLTVAIDKIAASGGYLMACVANQIIASPFSIIGSIGVVAQLPNFHRFLKKHDIDYEQITAGEYKRTLTVFGENTERAREKFKEDLELIHEQFKSFLKNYRSHILLEEVATGEYWLGEQALKKGLVDELSTSDDYLLKSYENAEIYLVKYQVKKSISEKMKLSLMAGLHEILSLVKWH